MSRWDGIEEFVAVAHAGSFVGGARICGTSTAHVSRAIARLESRLSAQLFVRTTRMVRLTDTGQVLLDHSRRLIEDREEAFALASQKGAPQGEVRITSCMAMGELYIAPIVRRFCQKYPKVRATVEITDGLVDLVGERFDLAVRTGKLTDSRLIGSRIASRTWYTCASPDYLRRAGTPRTVADLANHECLTAPSRMWHFRISGRDHIHRSSGRWASSSGIALVDAALDGMGICQLPELYVLHYISSGALVPVLCEFQPDEEPIWALYVARRHLPPKVSWPSP